MVRNIYVKIDEDVLSIIKKIRKLPESHLVLVVPKNALIFSDRSNLLLIKRQAEHQDTEISVLTMDPEGQRQALEAGLELRSFEALKRSGPNMDIARKRKDGAAEPKAKPSITEPIMYEGPWQSAVPIVAEDEDLSEDEGEEDEEVVEPQPRSYNPQRTREEITELIPATPRKKRKWAIALLVILLLGALGYALVPFAEVTVYADTTPLIRDFRISVAPDSRLDSSALTIPGNMVDEVVSLNSDFETSGRTPVGAKASGTVQLYNYTGRTLRLNASTTQLIVGEKIYRFKSDVLNITPTRNFTGTNDPDPASLIDPVEVMAEQPGEDYNLPGNTRFEVLNQVLGRTQNLYAQNPEAMDNGTTRFSSNVSEEDLNKAREVLRIQIKDRFIADQAEKGFLATNSAMEVSEENITFNKNVGEQSTNFNGEIQVRVKALVVSREDLDGIVDQRVTLALENNQYVVREGEKRLFNYDDVDLNGGTGALTVHLETNTAQNIDENEVKKSIQGKSTQEMQDVLNDDPRMHRVEVQVRPGWYQSIPSFPSRIRIDVKPEIAE